MNKASVVMVSAGFYPLLGGAEKQALELSAALRRRGAAVRVLTRRAPGLSWIEEVRGVPVERLWCLGGGALNAASLMASLFARLWSLQGYDAIHVHLAGSPALAAALVGRLRGKRVFIKLGGGRGIGELAASSRSLLGRLKLCALRALRPQFLAVTRDLIDEARHYLGPDARVLLLPNGVDAQRYAPVEPVRKKELRPSYGWSEGLAFLYVGRLSPEKRLPDFIAAWAKLARGKKTFFALVGEGPERERIARAARAAGVEDQVMLMPPRLEVGLIYAIADVFVLPSISEGLSNALLEAMASGLAILASRVGGAVDAVAEGESGLLFAPTDDAELERQLGKLLADPGLAHELGQAARRAAVARFSLDKTAAECERLYLGEAA